MLRKILGVIAAFVVMMILRFISLTVVYNVLGADGVFGAGNYQPTIAWLAGALIVTMLVAIAGGYTAAAIGKGGTAKILALLVIVLGLIMAAATIFGPMKMPEARPAVITMFEAIVKMQEPVWMCLVIPVISAIGVMIGGTIKKK